MRRGATLARGCNLRISIFSSFFHDVSLFCIPIQRPLHSPPLILPPSHRPTILLAIEKQVQEIKKIQMKGGTCQGEANPTWLKQPGDVGVALFGAALAGYGTINAMIGHYRLATGKGKLE